MPRRDAAPPPRNTFFSRYGLSVILAGLFVLSWLGQAIAQWFEASEEAATHGQSLQLGDYFAKFLSATFENWQSEFLQLLTFAVLTVYFVHVGSAESKDGEDVTHAALERLEAQLDDIEERISRIEPSDSAVSSSARGEGKS